MRFAKKMYDQNQMWISFISVICSELRSLIEEIRNKLEYK